MDPAVCLVKVERPLDRGLFEALVSLAPPEKRERILRQRSRKKAEAMAVGAALVRHMLLRELGIPLEDQRMAYGPWGKPYLPDRPGAHFNLSHSGDWVACAVSRRAVGVDLQAVVPFSLPLARRVCSPEELAGITAAPDRAEAFARLWSRKEAHLKLLGRGISGGLREAGGEGAVLQSASWEGYCLAVASPPGREEEFSLLAP